MEDTNTSTGEDSSSALDVSSSNITRTRGSNSFSPTELGGPQIADESPPQPSGGVVDAIFQYLGGRTPGESQTRNPHKPINKNISLPPLKQKAAKAKQIIAQAKQSQIL
jgi:hypothetical protein